MSSQQQIDANRENAQSSTGPTSEAGKQRSSLNSTVHGFTGRTLVFTSEAERAKYETLVKNFQIEFKPQTAESRELLQQYTDLSWSIQQIIVQQNNILTCINQINEQFSDSLDFAALNLALEPYDKRYRTFGTYEQRRRRAANEVLERFHQAEQEHHDAVQEDLEGAAEAHISFKKLGQTWNPQEFGFVHSLPQIECFLAQKEKKQLLEMLRKEEVA